MEGECLANEIISGYDEALDDLQHIKIIADERYNLKKNVKKTLSYLEKINVNNVFYNRVFSNELKMHLVHNEFYVEVLRRAYEKDKFLFLTDEQKKKRERELYNWPNNLTRYQEDLYSVYTSKTWRYTEPLRKIGRTIRNILKSIQALKK